MSRRVNSLTLYLDIFSQVKEDGSQHFFKDLIYIEKWNSILSHNKLTFVEIVFWIGDNGEPGCKCIDLSAGVVETIGWSIVFFDD